MLNITVLILTFNEEKHIERCLRSLSGLVTRIVVVDSFSEDETLKICHEMGVDVYQNKWVNYSEQYQWGLDNCEINTNWTMRMDSDEYLEEELKQELIAKIPQLSDSINGIYLKRKVVFQGKWIRFGGFYPHILLRIWKTGAGRIEKRWMDEHIVLEDNRTIVFENDIVDENLNDIGWWTEKHNGYATREMIDLLNIKHSFAEADTSLRDADRSQARVKRFLKENVYVKLPLGLRPFLYFVYRYFVRLGFLDGKQGFIFHFLQGFWYRLLVDIKVWEVEHRGSDGDISEYIENKYNVKFNRDSC